MKDITRIHIAKIPYDIEVAAKKELESYIASLERYSDDPNLLEDIEIRMTEILLSLGTDRDGIISSSDVKAIREQLGDPKEFIGEDTVEVPEDLDDKPTRRLYRDTDTAVLGGVLSGIATYLGVNPLWIRIAFVILLFVSFGTASIVYLVLWLVMPAARTAAEKLQLAGRPVTLASIKKLRLTEDDEPANRTSHLTQNILLYGLGTMAAIAALLSLLATVWGGIGLLMNTSEGTVLENYLAGGWTAWTAYGLFVASGLLLTTLFTIVATALFRKKATKRIAVAIVAVILAGVATFSVAASTVLFGYSQESARVSSSRFTKTIDLPAQFTDVKQLIVDTNKENTSDVRIEYIVSKDKPRYELLLDESSSALRPTLNYSDNNKIATLSINKLSDTAHRFSQPIVKVYGPALDTITLKAGPLRYEHPSQQQSLAIVAENGWFELSGRYQSVTVDSKNDTSVVVSDATIENLKTVFTSGTVEAGVVKTLAVDQPNACPAARYSDQNRLTVEAVSSGVMTLNGKEQSAVSTKHSCGRVIVGDDDEL